MLTKPDACIGCPAYDCGRGFVPPDGPNSSTIAVVGQGPGDEEAHSGVPFTGASGRKLNAWFAKAGGSRANAFLTNVVQCHLPKNRAPTKEEAQFCYGAHLRPQLESLPNLRVIVPVGVPAFRRILGGSPRETIAGSTIQLGPKRWAVPLLHPAYILRGQFALEPAQVMYLERALRIAGGEDPTVPDVTKPPLGGIVLPTLADLVEWRKGLEACKDHTITCDIEGVWPALIGIGFCRLEDEISLYIPIRTVDAEHYWSLSDLEVVVRWLDDLLGDPSIGKVFHNGQTFDVPFLERLGFKVRGYVDDTLVLQHNTYADMPKRLEFCAILYAGLPSWKWLVSVGDEGDNK